jgi:hypothetical protein
MKFALLVLLFPPVIAYGTVVTTHIDEDNGTRGGGTGVSLREAVKYSPANETITFAPALSGQTIRLTGGHLLINQSLTIDASALPAGLTLSADRTGDGKTADDTYVIHQTSGNLGLDSLTFSDANCDSCDGCITVQAYAIFTLTLDRCTIKGNFGRGGSALHYFGNSATPNAAITLRNSTISGNSVLKSSAVVSVAHANLTIQNSTFWGNAAAAIYYRTGSTPTTLSISNSTITGNAAIQGYADPTGGIIIDYNEYPNTIFINNTICAGNETANISNPSPNTTISGTHNIFSGPPLLAPPGQYGGRTWTLPPLPGSPAINAGNTTLTADQRGLSRVAAPDIGAAEYQGTADVTRIWKFDADGDGSPYGVEQALGTDYLTADPKNPRNLTPPTFDASRRPILSFGLASAPPPGTRWILTCSPDLTPGSFTEIYRTDRLTDTAAPNVSFLRTADKVTITDRNPLPRSAYYRFEALQGP